MFLSLARRSAPTSIVVVGCAKGNAERTFELISRSQPFFFFGVPALNANNHTHAYPRIRLGRT